MGVDHCFVQRGAHPRCGAITVRKRVQVDTAVQQHRRQNIVDRKLATEAVVGFVETDDVQKVRMDIHLQAFNVVDLDVMLRHQLRRRIQRAQVAAAAGISFDRQTGVDN